jgi:hypothetical protein
MLSRWLGAVTKDGRPRTFACEMEVFLRHSDLVSLFEAILRTAPVDHRFIAMYAVSNNEGRMHDIANPFGWFPAGNSTDFFR